MRTFSFGGRLILGTEPFLLFIFRFAFCRASSAISFPVFSDMFVVRTRSLSSIEFSLLEEDATVFSIAASWASIAASPSSPSPSLFFGAAIPLRVGRVRLRLRLRLLLRLWLRLLSPLSPSPSPSPSLSSPVLPLTLPLPLPLCPKLSSSLSSYLLCTSSSKSLSNSGPPAPSSSSSSWVDSPSLLAPKMNFASLIPP